MLTPMRATVGLVTVFTVLMAVAAGWDVKRRRIPNGLVIATMVLGTTFELVTQGATRGASAAVGGVVVGLAVWLPWWWLGMMGAGDVKFFAAAAAWLGPRGALGAVVITALFGGMLSVCWLVARAAARQRGAPVGAARTRDGHTATDGAERAKVTLPYGVAMALGLGVAAWIPLIR